MDALITSGPGEMSLRQIDWPDKPGRGEVKLRVDAAGICGSDYSLFLGKHPLSVFPMIQGHEFCGTVVDIGPEGTGRVSVGDRVAVEPLIGCGHCYPCSVGRYNCCTELKLLGVHEPGGFQQEMLVAESLLHRVGDMPPDLAAFAEPLTIALQAVTRAGVSSGEQVFIIGAGPIGQALLLACRSKGARVAVSDLVPHRFEKARAIGAELALDAKGDVAEELSRWTDGRGPPVVIDATGAAGMIRKAVDIVAAAGRLVTVGISTTEVPLPIALLIRKELTLYASRNSVQMFPEAIRVLRKYQAEVAQVISHHIPLSQVEATIRLALERPDKVEKAIVMFDRP